MGQSVAVSNSPHISRNVVSISTEIHMNEPHDPSVLNSVKRIVNTTEDFVAAHARI
jgi:hypothetical protein